MPLYSPFPGFASLQQTREGIVSDLAVSPAALVGRACFSANKNAVDQTGIASATLTKITFGAEAFDQGGYFSTVNARWTPPPGFPVRMAARLALTGLNPGNSAFIYIIKNGVTVLASNYMTPAVSGMQVNITANDVPSGTDYYEVFVDATGSPTFTAGGSITATNFAGEQI